MAETSAFEIVPMDLEQFSQQLTTGQYVFVQHVKVTQEQLSTTSHSTTMRYLNINLCSNVRQ